MPYLNYEVVLGKINSLAEPGAKIFADDLAIYARFHALIDFTRSGVCDILVNCVLDRARFYPFLSTLR
jgi:hypothetical protein